MNLTNWLKKNPQPAAVLADDQRIEVGRNRRAYKDLTETIRAINPTKLTCLDAQGSVIRSTVLESDADDDTSKAPPSPEMSDLQLFAKLLAEAYDKASSKMQPIVDSAMAFVERGGQRLAKAESDNDRLRAHIFKLNARIGELSSVPVVGEEEPSILGAIAQAAIQSGALAAATQTQQQPAPVTPLKGRK